jgi:hypothetical protein
MNACNDHTTPDNERKLLMSGETFMRLSYRNNVNGRLLNSIRRKVTIQLANSSGLGEFA